MKKYYQEIISDVNGDCMRAAVASLLEIDIKEVPNFMEFGDEFNKELNDFLGKNGYVIKKTLYNKNYSRLYSPTHACFNKETWDKDYVLTKNNMNKSDGVDGFFIATVLSPKYYGLRKSVIHAHAVICDKNLNIVHDPNPEYKNIREYPLAKLLRNKGIIMVEIIEKIDGKN